ncbi:MAG: hypothetical protein H0T42_14750 [Deltaproteobacteria bacterium]|nr:hypothetical protein [Deltaproteobacteria bacterium]
MSIRSLVVVAVLAACGSSPAPGSGLGNSSTVPREAKPLPGGAAAPWIARLDQPREAARAIDELEQLGDPSAIEALGRHWSATGHPVRVLRVMIVLARPGSWDRVLPFLRTAVAMVDPATPRSVDNATVAADAIGEARLVAAFSELTELVSRSLDKKLVAAQVSAIRAIGALDTAEGTQALLAVIERPPPPHPRTATSRDQGRSLEELYALSLATTGAAINALGTLPSAQAAQTLVLAMYRTPELSTQLRRALALNGALVIDHVRAILRGTHVAVNELFTERKLDRYCGDRDKLPAAKCQPVSAKDFIAATLAGDLYDLTVVPELLEALKRPPLPYYYLEDQPGPNTQHHAIFDSLRKLGADEATAAVRAFWINPKAEVSTRTLAVATYGFLARTDKDVAALGKIAADNRADDGLRQEATSAYARIARDPKHIKLLLQLSQRYLDAAATKRKAANAAKPATKKADAALAKADKAWTDAKAKLLQVANDASSTTDQIRAATSSTKQTEDTYRTAKKKHREQTAPYRQHDQAAVAYIGYARMFQTHVARIEIAIRCQNDLRCYAASLTQTVAEAEAHVMPHIPDVAAWTREEKAGLVDAAIERAMLELARQETAASEHTPALLEHVATERRLIREAILLTLPRIAKLPCPTCVTRLDTAIAAGEGKPELGTLVIETTLVRNYFRRRGSP